MLLPLFNQPRNINYFLCTVLAATSRISNMVVGVSDPKEPTLDEGKHTINADK
jgi:hypothetical protein